MLRNPYLFTHFWVQWTENAPTIFFLSDFINIGRFYDIFEIINEKSLDAKFVLSRFKFSGNYIFCIYWILKSSFGIFLLVGRKQNQHSETCVCCDRALQNAIALWYWAKKTGFCAPKCPHWSDGQQNQKKYLQNSNKRNILQNK